MTQCQQRDKGKTSGAGEQGGGLPWEERGSERKGGEGKERRGGGRKQGGRVGRREGEGRKNTGSLRTQDPARGAASPPPGRLGREGHGRCLTSALRTWPPRGAGPWGHAGVCVSRVGGGVGRGRQAGILVKTEELSGRPGPDSTLKGTLGAVLFEGLPFMECVLEQFRTQYA